MKKSIISLFLLLFLFSCKPGIRQDVSFEKGSYKINTWFVEASVSCSGNNRLVYDETVKVPYENLEQAKKVEIEKAEKILHQMQGKKNKKTRK